MKKVLFGLGTFALGGVCGIVLACSAAAKVIAMAIDEGRIELNVNDSDFDDEAMRQTTAVDFVEAMRQRKAEQAQAAACATDATDADVPCRCDWPWEDDEKHFPEQSVLDRQMPLAMTEPGGVYLL